MSVLKSITYNKLVRDRIPEIIEKSGNKCVIEILSDEKYIEELADLLEVIYACAQARGFSLEELENVRATKADKRGAFKDKIFLKETVIENE